MEPLPMPRWRLLRPGTQWMRRQALPTKLRAVALALLLPLVLLMLLVLLHAGADLQRDARERAGVAAVRQMVRVMTDEQRLRQALLHAEPAGREALLRDARERVQSGVAAVDAWLADVSDGDVPTAWPAARTAALALVAQHEGRPHAETLALGTDAVAALQATLHEVALRSGLGNDPQMATWSLVPMGVQHLPHLMESTARALAESALVARRGEASKHDRWNLAMRVEAMEQSLGSARRGLHAMQFAGLGTPAGWQPVEAGARRFAGLVRAGFDGLAIPDDGSELAAAGTQALEPMLRLADDLFAELDARLQARTATTRWTLLLTLAACLGSGGLSLYLLISFIRSFAGSMKVLRRSVQHLADGDLTVRVAVHGSDELAQMSQELERTAGRLSSVVAEIRTSAVRVDQAGADVARDGQAVAHATEARSSSVHDAVVAVRALSSAAAESQVLLERLDGRVRELGEHGARCREAMGGSVDAMRELDDGMRRVAEVNAVIDDIAFQTNLLSINASVEAARAGDAGKGFGVVAASVRALSVRCAEAAAEVRQLIDRTAEQSHQAHERVAEAHGLSGRLAGGIDGVQADLARLASVGAQQEGSLAEVSTGLGSMEELGQVQSRALSAVLSASRALGEQAEVLRGSVRAIRLRQGSADEARAMVERALQRIAERGWEAAVREFHLPGGPYIDRDLYLFAVDADDRYVVAGFNPALAGRTAHELPRMTSTMLAEYLQLARSTAAAGGGWVDYQLIDPASGGMQDKSAYIADLGDGAFIGCGVVRQVLGGTVPEPQPTAVRPAPVAERARLQAADAPEPALVD